MGAIGAEDLTNWEKLQGMENESDQKILVLVMLIPLKEKEIARNEVTGWECINSTTILYRNSLQERSGLPTAYSFDQRGDCTTREVYEEGTKDIAFFVVGGINYSRNMVFFNNLSVDDGIVVSVGGGYNVSSSCISVGGG